MRQYGKKKTRTSVVGHQDCKVCHPDREKPRKKRARQASKKSVAESEFDGPDWDAADYSRHGTPEEYPEPDDLEHDLKMFLGLPPFNTPSNFCYLDGYFALSIEKKYGKKIAQLKAEVGL